MSTQKYISTPELADRFRRSKRTIERWVGSRGFPKPALASRGAGSLWLLADVERWERDEIARNAGISLDDE